MRPSLASGTFKASGPNPYMASDVNRRTAHGGRILSFRSVITGLLWTRFLLAASTTFGTRCQPEAAPNTYPGVGRLSSQQGATTVSSKPHAQETHSYPHTGLSNREDRPPGRGPRSVLARRKGSLQAKVPPGPHTTFSEPEVVPGADPSHGVGDRDAVTPSGIVVVPPQRRRPSVRPRAGPSSATSSPARSGWLPPPLTPAAESSRGPESTAVKPGYEAKKR